MATDLGEFLETLFKNRKKDRKPLDKERQECLDLASGKDIARVWKIGEGQDWRSKTFIKTLKVKVFTAISMIADLLLQGGKIPFALKPSPYNPLGAESPEPPLEKDGAPASGSGPTETMSDKINEQLADRKADRHYLRKLLSLGLYGDAWAKYTVAAIERDGFAPDPETGAWQAFEYSDNVPGWDFRSVWAIYPDLEVVDQQKGQGIIERALYSPFELRQKEGQKGYFDKAIDRIISEHEKNRTVSDTESLPPGQRSFSNRVRDLDCAIFWGRAPRKHVERFEKEANFKGFSDILTVDDPKDDGDEVEIKVEFLGDEVFCLQRNPSGWRPYTNAVWEIGFDEESSGTGIGENVKDVQIMLNGVVRAFEDNKKLTANVLLAIKERFMVPGAMESFSPGDKIPISETCDDVRKAVQQVTLQDVGQSLLSAFGLAQTLTDDVSQVPKIMQGTVLPKQKPDTLGEVNMLMDAAGKYLGLVLKNIDDGFIEPEISAIYKYNMRNPEYKGEKANLIIHPTGFASFANKIKRAQTLQQLLTLILSNEVLMAEAKIRPHLTEIYKAQDVDPDEFLKSEQEKLEDQQRQAQQMEEARRMADEEAAKAAEEEDEAKEREFQRDVVKESLKEGLKAVK